MKKNTEKNAKKKFLSTFAACIAVVLALLLILLLVFLIAFRHELKTLGSLQEKCPGVYTMSYDGDYGFDDFLKTGAQTDADIEIFVTRRLLRGLPLTLNITKTGCTAFTAKNENGDVLFARNFDFAHSPVMQLHTKPKNGYASVSTVNLSYAGYSRERLPAAGIRLSSVPALAAPFLAFDGMNEKGVSIALLSVPEVQLNHAPDKVTLNTTTAIRLVLDKAASVDEAVALLRQYNIYFSGGINCHYLLADASGSSVIVEYYANDVQAVKADTPYQIASNFIAYNGLNIGEGFSEFDRYNAVEAVLHKQHGIVSVSDCEQLLNRIGVYDGDTDKLQWSVVYNLTAGSGRFWPYRNLSKGWDFTR